MNDNASASTPRSIRKGDELHLEIAWKDGHDSTYSTAVLRRACPCAACIDEWTGEAILDPLAVLDTAKPVRVEPVGRYAIRIVWDDGHESGIYTFQNLRSLCPCAECNPPEK